MMVAMGLVYIMGRLSAPEYSPTAEELLEDAKHWCRYGLMYSTAGDNVYKTFQQDLKHIEKGNIQFNNNPLSVGIHYDFLMECAKSWHELPQKQKDLFFRRQEPKNIPSL